MELIEGLYRSCFKIKIPGEEVPGIKARRSRRRSSSTRMSRTMQSGLNAVANRRHMKFNIET